jgi:AraC family transcriptional regulator of adaptative response/methylated-DNA-[protein]-cysteine methyltransferase
MKSADATTFLMPDEETMFDAFVRRDATFEGLFVMGVRSTGIFCRPTCPARKPLRQNVEFFPRAGDALAAGYRPCMRCRPLDAKGATPQWLKPLLEAVESNPQKRWTTAEIIEFGLEPARVRRWFQAQHGMTFLAYLRARRLGRAFSRIKEGEKVLETAIDADFDSVSGFCEALLRSTGKSPRSARTGHAMQVAQMTSPLGPIMIAGDDQAIVLVEFWDRRMLETQFQVLQKRLDVHFFPGENTMISRMRDELETYFAGSLRQFTTPLHFPGSEHQKQVWQALLEIPYGTTESYAELATRIGRKSAVRAVAKAVGENRLAIVLPCHRIVGSNGKLTGYGGGLWRKRFLLNLEGEN